MTPTSQISDRSSQLITHVSTIGHSESAKEVDKLVNRIQNKKLDETQILKEIEQFNFEQYPIDAKSSENRTLLYEAYYAGLFRVCELLIQKKANVLEKCALPNGSNLLKHVVPEQNVLSLACIENFNLRNFLFIKLFVSVVVSQPGFNDIPKNQRTELNEAFRWASTQRDNLDVVKLLTPYVDVNSTSKDGMYPTETALAYAIQNRDLGLLKHLIGNGADLNQKTASGDTPIHFAVLFGWVDAVTHLLENGADITIKDHTGRRAYEIKPCDPKCTSHLIADTILQCTTTDTFYIGDEISPRLKFAIIFGTVNAIREELTKSGGNPNIFIDTVGQTPDTPLTIACRTKDLDKVKFLLESGAAPNFWNDKTASPLLIACTKQVKPMVDLLVRAGAQFKEGETQAAASSVALSSFLALCEFETFKSLIRLGVDPNRPSYAYDELPLSLACSMEEIDKVDYLISLDSVTVNSRNNGGQSALHLAILTGNVELVKKLTRSQTIDMNLPDGKGYSALTYAAGHGMLTIVKMLLDDPRVDKRFAASGETPVDAAIIQGKWSMVLHLLKENLFTEDEFFRAAMKLFLLTGEDQQLLPQLFKAQQSFSKSSVLKRLFLTFLERGELVQFTVQTNTMNDASLRNDLFYCALHHLMQLNASTNSVEGKIVLEHKKLIAKAWGHGNIINYRNILTKKTDPESKAKLAEVKKFVALIQSTSHHPQETFSVIGTSPTKPAQKIKAKIKAAAPQPASVGSSQVSRPELLENIHSDFIHKINHSMPKQISLTDDRGTIYQAYNLVSVHGIQTNKYIVLDVKINNSMDQEFLKLIMEPRICANSGQHGIKILNKNQVEVKRTDSDKRYINLSAYTTINLSDKKMIEIIVIDKETDHNKLANDVSGFKQSSYPLSIKPNP